MRSILNTTILAALLFMPDPPDTTGNSAASTTDAPTPTPTPTDTPPPSTPPAPDAPVASNDDPTATPPVSTPVTATAPGDSAPTVTATGKVDISGVLKEEDAERLTAVQQAAQLATAVASLNEKLDDVDHEADDELQAINTLAITLNKTLGNPLPVNS